MNESEVASGDEDGRGGSGVGLLQGARRRKTDKDDDLWTPQGKETVCTCDTSEQVLMVYLTYCIAGNIDGL